MEWSKEFYAWRAGENTHIVPRYADDPRPGWPFPFPDPDPPSMTEDRLDSDLVALRHALRSGPCDEA